MFKWIAYFLFFVLTVVGSKTFAQNKKKIDSLIKASTFKVYENPDQAIVTGRAIYEDPKNDLRTKIRGLFLMSDGYSSKRDYQKSIDYINKANTLSAQLDDPILRIKIINKIGSQYQQLKIYDKSIQYLDQSERLCLAYPVRDSVRLFMGTNYIIRGFIYKEKLNCDIAISFFDRGIAEYSNVKTPAISANLSIAFYNKGNCYFLLLDNEAAKASFFESIRFAKKIKANSLQAFAQKGLAEVYTQEGKYAEAIAVLEEALHESKDVGDLVLNQGVYKGLSENYLAVSQWENYQKFHAKYLQTQLQIKGSERQSVSQSLHQAKKTQNEQLEEILPKYNYGIFALVCFTILILAFFIFSEIKTKKSIIRLQQSIANLQKIK